MYNYKTALVGRYIILTKIAINTNDWGFCLCKIHQSNVFLHPRSVSIGWVVKMILIIKRCNKYWEDIMMSHYLPDRRPNTFCTGSSCVRKICRWWARWVVVIKLICHSIYSWEKVGSRWIPPRSSTQLDQRWERRKVCSQKCSSQANQCSKGNFYPANKGASPCIMFCC